jgi:programmed cell death protein 4
MFLFYTRTNPILSFTHTLFSQLDCPSAASYLTSFLSRAVVDELLPPSFLADPLVKSLGGHVIEDAIRVLSREHCSVRLEKVWGPGDGRPVAELKVAMDQLLKEYLLSRELDEALNCVNEIKAPHFHHELVKRGVKTALDSSNPAADVDAMAHLFKFLHSNDVLSTTQLKKGFDRCYSLLDDLKLDNPAAPDFLKAFVEAAMKDKCLEEGYTPPQAPVA